MLLVCGLGELLLHGLGRVADESLLHNAAHTSRALCHILHSRLVFSLRRDRHVSQRRSRCLVSLLYFLVERYQRITRSLCRLPLGRLLGRTRPTHGGVNASKVYHVIVVGHANRRGRVCTNTLHDVCLLTSPASRQDTARRH